MKLIRAVLSVGGDVVAKRKADEAAIGRVDARRLDATTEEDITRHTAEDEEAARRDAAAYARRVRKRTGLTQAAFAARIGVPLDTVRNWEQGKRSPAGPARALLKVLDRAPEMTLAALE